MAKKAYSNIYTILEKSRKGELDFDDSSSSFSAPSLFSSIEVIKRKELIAPHVHYIDAYNIRRVVRKHITSEKVISKISHIAAKNNLHLKPDETMPEVIDKAYNAFPTSLTYDIFNLLNKDLNHLSFVDRTAENKAKYQFLEKSNLPVEKIMTNGSNVKSLVFTQNLVEAFITMMTLAYLKDNEKFEDLKDQLNNDCGKNDQQQQDCGNQSSPQQGNNSNSNPTADIDKLLSSKLAKETFEKAINQAREQCQNISEVISKEEEDNLWNQLEKDADAIGSVSPEAIEKAVRELDKINLSMGSLKEHIKKILDKSISYFSGREIVEYEGIFDADSMAGLEEYHLLHPELRKAMADDIQIKTTKKVGKLNIYVDVSGSMGSGSGNRDAEGNYIDKITFAKALVVKMKEMNLLNKLYAFDTRLYPKGNKITDILSLHPCGGTTLDIPVHNIIKNDENGIILTDAEGHCSIYSPKAFFLGVKGADFRYFHKPTLEQYYQSQMFVYDGQTVNSVDAEGNEIKR